MWIDRLGRKHSVSAAMVTHMQSLIQRWGDDAEPGDLAADTASVFQCWEALSGDSDVPGELLDTAEKLIESYSDKKFWENIFNRVHEKDREEHLLGISITD